MVCIFSCPLHKVVLPSPFVFCSICEFKDAAAVVLVAAPLTSIGWAVRIAVCTVALHFVLVPIAFIGFGRGIVGGRKSQFAESVFCFLFVYYHPSSFIDSSVEVLKFAVSKQFVRFELRLGLFRRLFHRFLVLFGWHRDLFWFKVMKLYNYLWVLLKQGYKMSNYKVMCKKISHDFNFE